MAQATDNFAKSLIKALDEKDKKSTNAYDTRAEIRNIKDGKAWVHIPGGVDETPVDLTINAKVGDTVQIRVAGGRAWITGNASSPPTDDTRANVAYSTAGEAFDSAAAASAAANNAMVFAEEAERAAGQANTILGEMENAATLAETSLTQIFADAKNAEESAEIANDAAKTAVYGLSQVEDVVGTIRWIERNGKYEPTQDEFVKSNKAYYKLVGTSYVMVTNPVTEELPEYYELKLSDTVQNYIMTHLTIDDSGLSLRADNVMSRLLLSNGVYSLTTDTTVNTSKTYYTRSGTAGSYNYTKVANPVASELSTYYEAVVLPGVTLYGPDGKAVANYGEDAQIGRSDGYNIKIRSSGSNARLSFCLGELEVAYMSGDMLYIPKAVVVDAMQVGDVSTGAAWQWIIKEPTSPFAGNLTLTWMGV